MYKKMMGTLSYKNREWKVIKIMYVDEQIVLRDNLPGGLQRDFIELQGYYNAGDWFMFDTAFEAMEVAIL